MPNYNQSGISGTTAEVVSPLFYRLNSVVVKNYSGKEFDIRQLVTDFSITESIYRPTLVLSMDVKDSVNMLEELRFSGQEEITVSMSRKAFGATVEENIDLAFIVTEYPVYGKFMNRLQVYSLRGISRHAYVSKLKKVSRAYAGTGNKFISDILRNELDVPADKIVESKSSTEIMKCIVPNLAPLDAIAWMLRRMYDVDTGSPFYCYQTLDGKIHIASQSEMVAKESIGEFQDGLFGASDPLTKADYEEQSKRLMSIASDLRMSKYGALAGGAYGSKSLYVDLATKSTKTSDFSYSKDGKSLKTLDSDQSISDKFKPDTKRALSEFSATDVNYISVNSLAFTGERNYHSAALDGQINRSKCYVEILDSLMHDIVVPGNFKLNSGEVLGLKLTKAADPSAKLTDAASNPNALHDELLSGKYLVSAVIHKFGAQYTSEARIKKDSFPKNYFSK